MPSSARETSHTGLRISVAPEPLTIHIWHLRQRPVSSLLAICVAILASVFVGWWFEFWPLGGIIAVLLTITGWTILLPQRYELSNVGVRHVVLGRVRLIPWAAIRRYTIHATGVVLLPDDQVIGLSPLRGLFLPWSGKRQEILAHLEYHLQSSATNHRSQQVSTEERVVP